MKQFFGKPASNYHLTHRKMHNIQMYIKFSVLCWFLSFSLQVNLHHKCPVTRANDPQFGHNGFVIQIIIQQIIHLITPERVANSNTYKEPGRQSNWKCTWSEEGIKVGGWQYVPLLQEAAIKRFYTETFESWRLETNANYLNVFEGQIILCELGGSLHLWSR